MRGFHPTGVEEVMTETMRERKARRVAHFIKFPLAWVDRLNEVNATSAAYRVALELLRRAWRARGATVTLPRIDRVSRNGKRSALHQLELAGLISVERRSRKSPIVTMRLVD